MIHGAGQIIGGVGDSTRDDDGTTTGAGRIDALSTGTVGDEVRLTVHDWHGIAPFAGRGKSEEPGAAPGTGSAGYSLHSMTITPPSWWRVASRFAQTFWKGLLSAWVSFHIVP